MESLWKEVSNFSKCLPKLYKPWQKSLIWCGCKSRCTIHKRHPSNSLRQYIHSTDVPNSIQDSYFREVVEWCCRIYHIERPTGIKQNSGYILLNRVSPRLNLIKTPNNVPYTRSQCISFDYFAPRGTDAVFEFVPVHSTRKRGRVRDSIAPMIDTTSSFVCLYRRFGDSVSIAIDSFSSLVVSLGTWWRCPAWHCLVARRRPNHCKPIEANRGCAPRTEPGASNWWIRRNPILKSRIALHLMVAVVPSICEPQRLRLGHRRGNRSVKGVFSDIV